jgi:17beta-estradiol 17-dehydrogenase / very-long-chain 3-oxoacyl-CoA reductase
LNGSCCKHGFAPNHTEHQIELRPDSGLLTRLDHALALPIRLNVYEAYRPREYHTHSITGICSTIDKPSDISSTNARSPLTTPSKSPMGYLTLLGTAVFLRHLFKLANIVWFYFFRKPDEYTKYQQGPQPYALITGATDGIGKSLAKNLYQKGFNVIIHGRNEKKLKATVEEIKSLREKGVVESFLADAAGPDVDFAGIAKRFNDLNITLFVNNVGEVHFETKRQGDISRNFFDTIADPNTTARFEEWSEGDHLAVIRCNAVFPTFLTRAFLPSLRKTSLSHPVLVVFSGALSAEFAVPLIPLHAASKAFIRRLPSNLRADERFVSGKSNIEFMHVYTGIVQSNTVTVLANLFRPTSDDYAAHIVKVLGSGRMEVIPYVGHLIGLTILRGLPDFLQWRVLKEGAKGLLGN